MIIILKCICSFAKSDLSCYKCLAGQLFCHTSVSSHFYLLPLLLPAGGFFSWRRGTPVAKPAVGWLDTPKVRPADWLMPGLLKLKPELLLLPKPREGQNHKVKPMKNKVFTEKSWYDTDLLNNLKWMMYVAFSTCTQTASRGLTGGGEAERTPSPHPNKSWPATKTCARERHESQSSSERSENTRSGASGRHEQAKHQNPLTHLACIRAKQEPRGGRSQRFHQTRHRQRNTPCAQTTCSHAKFNLYQTGFHQTPLRINRKLFMS